MRLQAVSKLGVRDRIVLALLRAPGRSDRSDAVPDAFRALALSARDHGAVILDADIPYASRHELCLLGLLAIHQREQPPAAARVNPALREQVIACSIDLTARDILLDHATVIRLFEVADDALVTDLRMVRYHATGVNDARKDRPSACALDKLHSETLDYVRERRCVTSRELRRLGISRQITSQMVKRGLIHRLQFGVYGVAPDVAHA